MEKLIKELDYFKKKLSTEERKELSDNILDKLYSVYPFNKFPDFVTHFLVKI